MTTLSERLKADPCRRCPPMECFYEMRKRLSLTRELNSGGCAHYYMGRALPNLAAYVKSLKLPKGNVLIEAPQGWESFTGIAFDRRLRYEYEPDYEDQVVMHGAYRLGGGHIACGETTLTYDNVLGSSITEEGRTILDGLKSEDLDERAIHAAIADVEFRTGRGMQTLYALQEGGELLKRQLINDNQKLMTIAREQLPLTDPKFGPTFGPGSVWIGGADGDLVDNKCLIDIKCVKNVEATAFLRQIIAYALLDVENEHDLNKVGIYLARQGILWSIPLCEVAKQAGITLKELRDKAPWANTATGENSTV